MKLRSLLPISIALGVLAGCGLKGPLYLPGEKGQEASAERDEQQKRDRARDSGAQPPTVPTDTITSAPPALPPEN